MSKNKVLHLFRTLVYIGFLVERKNGVHTCIVEVLCTETAQKLEREALHTRSPNAKSLFYATFSLTVCVRVSRVRTTIICFVGLPTTVR